MNFPVIIQHILIGDYFLKISLTFVLFNLINHKKNTYINSITLQNHSFKCQKCNPQNLKYTLLPQVQARHTRLRRNTSN